MICGVVNEQPVNISNFMPAGIVHIKTARLCGVMPLKTKT